MNDSADRSSRRDFLKGQSAREVIAGVGDRIADAIESPLAHNANAAAPVGGDTIRLETRSMACRFAVIMNPGFHAHVATASEALENIHALERQMTVYQPDSELSRINHDAAAAPVEVETGLFGLLELAHAVSRKTMGGFDPTSGPLVELWHRCRMDDRIPAAAEIDDCLGRVGIEHVRLDAANRTVQFDRPGVELNLGAIGKGYALDRSAELLNRGGIDSWLLHGGHSSLLARGDHFEQGGWPVGIGNPLFTDRRLGTILLKDQALATSGSNIQYFRHDGRRYGHILDPRTGWPADGLLSVTVLASTAALADALSTAFFVLGVENARTCCDNLDGVSAILIPQPVQGRRLRPVMIGVPDGTVFWNSDQVVNTY